MAVLVAPHIVKVPKNFVAIHCIQLVFAVIVFGLTMYGLSVVSAVGIILCCFTSICTIIVAGYTIGATHGKNPKAYNYWAILALEIFLLVMWLVSFGILAAQIAVAGIYTGGGYYSSYYGNYYSSSYDNYYYNYTGTVVFLSLLGAAAGIGAIEFLLYFISLIIFSVMLYRHRRDGGHCVPRDSEAAGVVQTAAYNPNLQSGAEKVQMTPQTLMYPAPVQNAYAHPPQFAQEHYAPQ